MIKLPKFRTHSIYYLKLNPDYSDDPILEFYEWLEGKERLEKELEDYCLKLVGNNYNTLDYPKRMTVLDENKNRMYFHINEAIYSKDFSSHLLISKNYMEDEITLIYQVEKEK